MRPITFILGLILGLGICLRFDNLAQKVYWYDEAFTSLRAAGYTEVEVVENFAQSSVITAADLQRFQQPNPERGIQDTLHSLAVEDTHHPPLYYSLSHVWMRTVGSSVANMRALSALLSLLIFPALYWLCWELFGQKQGWKSAAGWMSMAIVAVSPFHLLYAQEARQYSLWAATTVLMTAALIRAVRRNTGLSWGMYALSALLGLYTFLFTALVMIAHGIYVLAMTNVFTINALGTGNTLKNGLTNRLDSLRFNFTLKRYFLASFVAVIFFLPWVWIVATNLEQAKAVTEWTTHQRPLLGLMTSWANILGELFYNRGTTIADRAVQVGIIALIGTAFYYLCRYAPKAIWLPVVTLTAVPSLALMLPDVLLGGHRSAFPRYLTPALIGIQIAVAYVLTLKTLRSKQSRRQSFFWKAIVVAMLVGGMVSSIATVEASSASIKWLNDVNLAVAPIVNQEENALLISDTATADLLSLSHSLNSNVRLLIRPRCYTCRLETAPEIDPTIFQIPEGYETVYLFHPRSTKAWRESLRSIDGYQVQPVDIGQDEALWRVNPT